MAEAKKKILVVEDEALIADHIELSLTEAGYEVAGVFDNAEDLFVFLQNGKADLLLLDINLGGNLDGVDIAHHVNRQYKLPIVFLTSNTDKKTIDRVKLTTPAGFIAKPFTVNDLSSNIEIALFKTSAPVAPGNNEDEKSIFIKEKSVLVKLLYKDISYVEAMDNYAILYTGSKKHIVPHTLKILSDLLEPEGFVKTHRSFLVNTKKISAIHPKAVIVDTKEVPLSENFRSAVVSLFNTL